MTEISPSSSSSKWFSGNKSAELARDLLSGSGAGFVCKFVEYPMDTVKVLLQTNGSAYKGPIDCIKKTVKANGVLSLYRGLASPLAGSVVENAVVFSINGAMKNALGVDESKGSKANALWKYFISGAFAGVGTSVVLTPVELIKCKLQVMQDQPSGSSSKKIGPINVMFEIIRTEGIQGLFRGQLSCMMREIPGNATWFGVYEIVRRAWQDHFGIDKRADLPLLYSALSGSVAGMAYWAVPFPADTVKTKLQTDPRYAGLSFQAAFKKVLKEEGVKGVYRGLDITVARAAPSHFIIFFVYEYIYQFLGNY